MIKEQEMLEIELKENFEKDIDIIRNHITSLRLIGVGLSNTLNEKDAEIERLNNGLKDIKWYIEKNKTSFSDLYIPASDVVSVLVIINRLLGSDKN